jgi:hypothetical protein
MFLPTLPISSIFIRTPDKDIIDISDHQVTFRYTDSQTNQSATRSLPTNQFLMLILQHVLPKGLQRVVVLHAGSGSWSASA